ncbi:hypothetical protein HYT05_05045 [Candidatus Kaiserbacteria bacterium]|nr:hypothetical protein [Candidatus Kaiserbacteria bacterium]
MLKILSGRNYTPYTVQIPAQQISCPITVIGSAIPPNAPTVTDVGACTQEIAHSYKIVATDSDTAAQLHYGIDWNNDAVVDEWVPATGYVAQGTQQTISHIWMTSGSHTFKVIAVDSQGNHSTWTSHTVSCAITPSEPVVLITATPVEWGAVSTLQWSSTGASSCTGTGFSTGGSTSGTITTGPVTQTTTYSIMCDAATDFTTITINVCPSGYTGTPPTCTLSSTQCPPGYTGTPPNCAAVSSCPLGYTGTPPNCICSPSPICSGTNLVNSCTGAVIKACSYSCSNNACVVLAPQVVSWSVAPKLVSKGNTTNVSWEVKHVSSCTVTGTNGDSWTGLKGTKLSGPISSQTIFSLICQPLSGSAAGAVTRSTTVNITPTFIER